MVISTELPVEPAQHLAIVDALYRFGAGQDMRDRALFESAFVPDAMLDFIQPARDVGGVEMPLLLGRKAIADTVFANIGELDTTHTVSNPRITAYDGRHAALWALVEAQHLPRGDHGRHLLLKNIYEVRLSEAQGLWRIEHLHIRNVWWNGDPAVLFPRAPVRVVSNPDTELAHG